MGNDDMRIITIDPEDWPRCGKCNMPVEQFCVTDTGDALILVAACHENVEKVIVSDTTWDKSTKLSDIIIGPAFSNGETNEHIAH